MTIIRHRTANRRRSLVVLLVLVLFILTMPFSAKAFINLDDLKDREDGALDLSYWLAEKKGFLPIIMPITEPAVGYGLAIAPMFLHQSIAELQSEAGSSGTFLKV